MAWKLYIVRHCQPASSVAGYKGGDDAPLSEHGLLQAEYVAARMKQWGIQRMYSSSLLRVLQTAEAIQRHTGTDWHIWPALSEVPGRGNWPKLREKGIVAHDYRSNVELHNSLEHQYPEHIVSHPKVKFSQPFEPSRQWSCSVSETREQSYHRAEIVLEELRKRYWGTNSAIAVVCHGAFGSILLTLLNESSPCDYNRFNQAHGAISRVDFDNDWANGQYGPAIRFTNDRSHFPDEVVTEGVLP
ncbi:histidine phosphatase family protein [Paenibacillus chungangensis]|uniref:Histidine phosphatase family protein n=1 Tax=Paenibacillus chungangensis TaxID=696535 RepID=A0ABW3HX24_9BACL